MNTYLQNEQGFIIVFLDHYILLESEVDIDRDRVPILTSQNGDCIFSKEIRIVNIKSEMFSL